MVMQSLIAILKKWLFDTPDDNEAIGCVDLNVGSLGNPVVLHLMLSRIYPAVPADAADSEQVIHGKAVSHCSSTSSLLWSIVRIPTRLIPMNAPLA